MDQSPKNRDNFISFEIPSKATCHCHPGSSCRPRRQRWWGWWRGRGCQGQISRRPRCICMCYQFWSSFLRFLQHRTTKTAWVHKISQRSFFHSNYYPCVSRYSSLCRISQAAAWPSQKWGWASREFQWSGWLHTSFWYSPE